MKQLKALRDVQRLTGFVLVGALVCLIAPASAWSQTTKSGIREAVSDEADSLDEDAPASDGIYDPLEGMNRGIFWFNNKLDDYLLEPVATFYDDNVPKVVQDGINNFFDNLEYPALLLSDIVQLKFDQAGTHTARFLINTSVGVAGFIDVAKGFGIEPHEEDFGTALGWYDVPPGPYLVLPILGPSNLRDAFGRVVDTAVHPFTILEYYTDVRAGVTDKIVYPARGVEAVQSRADLLDAVEAAKESAVDYYLFVQSAYYQYRDGLIHDKGTKEDDEFSDDL